MAKKIAVVGAGIAGITTAYYLAKAGYAVTVFEQEGYPAMRTSYANGGQVSVSNSEVWNTWSNVRKGVKWIFTKDAPLLVRPKPTWAKIKWLAQFLYYTAKGSYKANTIKSIELGLQSRKLYQEIQYDENLKFDQGYNGILHFYKNPKYWEAARQVKYLYNDNGVEWDLVNRNDVNNFPGLKDIKGVLGGAYTPSDYTGDIHKFCYELGRRLKEEYNVVFKFNWKINKLKDIIEHYDAVVVSAGVGSVEVARSVGDSLPIYPVKGYSITVNNVDPKFLPKVSLLDDEAKIVTATLGNRFRVAGTAELDGENYDIRRDRIEPLLRWVRTNFPNINCHDYSSWTCLRPMTPNMLPIVKQSDKNSKVFYNTGHGHLGWTYSPATAQQVVELINEKINTNPGTN